MAERVELTVHRQTERGWMPTGLTVTGPVRSTFRRSPPWAPPSDGCWWRRTGPARCSRGPRHGPGGCDAAKLLFTAPDPV